MRLSKLKTSIGVVAAGLLCAALPAGASATVFSFSNDTDLTIPLNGGNSTPIYPSPVTVPVVGTVIDANVSFLAQHNQPDDLDIALVAPDGTAVEVMSDACNNDAEFQLLRFDEELAGGVALPDNPDSMGGMNTACDQSLHYIATNYEGPDDFTPGPSLPADFDPDLADFDGVPSQGTWSLYVRDDTNNAFGGTMNIWTLTLDIIPPLPPAGTTPATTPPAAPTGLRGAARKRCKKKRPASLRKRCIKKANNLPV
jgi:subtilisin-like proprotein convertase family protein